MTRIIFLLILPLIFSCSSEPKNTETKATENAEVEIPWWANTNIYEVNVRCFSEEGTFKAFQSQLDRLDNLGVEVLWFMPIHEIGAKNRKGTLGSYYSIKDYRSVNPEFGNKQDFKDIVNEAHSRDMKVILDWVANHTAWDHPWVDEHIEWYTENKDGERPTTPYDENGNQTDWTDVADLNYDNAEMQKAMLADMKYWIEEFDIDGFRCDVAHWVPTSFWKMAVDSLRAMKPSIIMLAEADYPPLVNEAGFDLDYGWDMHHRMNLVAQEKADVNIICQRMDSIRMLYNSDLRKMHFITNHDENSWNGTVEERMGEAGDAMAVLSFTLEGVPLIYNGQEAGLNKRLEFFEKDQIDWSNRSKLPLYKYLLRLKRENKALWNGQYGGDVIWHDCKAGRMMYTREKEGDKVLVMLNFTEGSEKFKFPEGFDGLTHFIGQMPGKAVGPKDEFDLGPNGYVVFSTPI